MASNQLVFNDEADPIEVTSSGDEGMEDQSPRRSPHNPRKVSFVGIPEENAGGGSDRPSSPWKTPRNRGLKRRRGKNALKVDGVDAGSSGDKPGVTNVTPGSPKHGSMQPKSGHRLIRTIR